MNRRVAWVALATLTAAIAAAAYLFAARDTRPKDSRSAWLRNAKSGQIGRCRCEPDEDVVIVRTDGLELAGSIDRPTEPGTHPVVVLLHGNTHLGRHQSAYRVLGRELASRGLIVLTVDFAGFGQSADPFALGNADALDKSLDAQAALDFARKLPYADPGSVQFLCHSMGCRAAFAVGLSDPRLSRIVAIGPPRRDSTLKNDDERLEYFWKRARETRQRIYRKDFPAWYTREMWMASVQAQSMEDYVPALSRRDHVPVLFIDGARESPTVRAYLQKYVARLSEPKCYFTVPNADHYLNTVRVGDEHVFDRLAFETLVAEILRTDSPCAPVKRPTPRS
jgi:dienelactone hydrolase